MSDPSEVQVRVVTVSGPPGSGTSTACRLLVERLGWFYVNAGGIFRQLAEEAGLSLAEYGRRAEVDPRIDRELDNRMVELARTRAPIVLEGRLTGWMAVCHGLEALRVWLDAPAAVRCQRVGRRDRQNGDQALAAMLERERSESTRYALHHGIRLEDLSIYHLVIDTGVDRPEVVVDRILARLGGGLR
ncbi:MAG: AAA family ATPase [Candidatus Latescibacterota bacterium]